MYGFEHRTISFPSLFITFCCLCFYYCRAEGHLFLLTIVWTGKSSLFYCLCDVHQVSYHRGARVWHALALSFSQTHKSLHTDSRSNRKARRNEKRYVYGFFCLSVSLFVFCLLSVYSSSNFVKLNKQYVSAMYEGVKIRQCVVIFFHSMVYCHLVAVLPILC